MTIHVCIGSACHLKGSYSVINALQSLIEEHDVGEQVEISAVFCLGHCTQAVSVQIEGEEPVHSLHTENVRRFFEEYVLAKIV
ncbi:MAG: (2Fe-2S) ferredoxin domain-containing protein [Christensenellales bacterium]|jgi:NADH:ubiquinone oxidoreductase subunit E